MPYIPTWNERLTSLGPKWWYKTNAVAGATVATDVSGNGNHGTYDSPASTTYELPSLIPSAPSEKSIAFTANAGNLRVNSVANLFDRRANTRVIVYKHNADTTGRLFEASSTSRLGVQASALLGEIGTEDVALAYDPSTLLSDNTARVLVYRVENTKVSFWVNGTKVIEANHTDPGGALESTDRIKGNAVGILGTFCHYVGFNRVLTDQEIADIQTSFTFGGTGSNGSIADDEMSWLTLAGFTTGSIRDREMAFLRSRAAAPANKNLISFNDLQKFFNKPIRDNLRQSEWSGVG